MLTFKADVRQSMLWLSLIFTLLNSNCGDTQSNDVSTSTNPSFFHNGRYHELPTVSIESIQIFSRRGEEDSASWGLFIPRNSIRNNDQVVVTVTGTFPFHAFLENPTDEDLYTGFTWESKRLVNGNDIFNTSSFTFKMIWHIPWSLLKVKNNSIECRSVVPPFFGISVQYFLNLQDKLAKFETSRSVSEQFKEYFKLMNKRATNESCVAYLFWDHSITTSGSHLNAYYCLFANGKPGVASEAKHYFIDKNFNNYNNKNCSMKIEDCNENISCDLQNLKRSVYYFSEPDVIFCKPEDAGDTISLMDIEIFTNKVNISSMIRMEPFEDIQELGVEILVTCTYSRPYAAIPLHFGVKYKDNSRITFFPAVDTGRFSENFNWESSSYNIALDNVDIERIFCFAPVRGSYDWINASRPVSVHEFFPPNFITDSENSALLIENIISIERTFLLGSKNESLLCDVTGFPIPSISWTHNNIPIEFIGDGTFQNQIERSVIVFPQIEKATEGVYICKAQNNQGDAYLLYNVVITDNSALILAASITPAVIGILLLFAVCYIIFWNRIQQRYRRTVAFLTDEELQEFVNGCQKKSNDRNPNASIMQQPFDPNYILPRSSLKFDNKKLLGSGHFGVVMNGWLCLDGSTHIQVAIKTTKQNVDVLHFKAFLSEVKISSFLNGHPNIVQFFGAWIENTKNGEIFAAYELCKQGDLLSVLWRRKTQLRNSHSKEIDDSLRLKSYNGEDRNAFIQNLFEWSRDIADGMAFLRSKNIIHGDLAARNVLLTQSNVAKISDFGLSRQLLNDYTIYLKKSKIPMPFKWLAPESLQHSNFSVQSDVWSFGITLWEIFSLGDPPYPGRRHDAKFVKDICEGMRPSKPHYAADWMYNIMIRCWDKDPECRPSIDSFALEIQEYIDKNQSGSGTNYTLL